MARTCEWARDRMRLATVLTLASGAPFDVTTGSDDDSHDLHVEDRADGVFPDARQLAGTLSPGSNRLTLLVGPLKWLPHTGRKPYSSGMEVHVPVAEAFRATLDLFQTGVDLMRQNLRRNHPETSDEDIDRLLHAWLLERPGAESGDCPGRPVDVNSRLV